MPALYQPVVKPFSAGALLLMLAAGACGAAAPDDAAVRQSPPSAGATVECRITRIADGDSVTCGSAGRIRLLLIDAPELSQGAPGRDAQRVLSALIPVGTRVQIQTDVRQRDSYQRILAYLFLEDGRMVNEEMARSGYATALVYPPNVRHVERIRRAVKEAQSAKRGLWATSFFDCSPRDFRAGRCGGPPPRNSRRRGDYSGKS